MSENYEERLAELDEEVTVLHDACEQYELAIELIGEMFTAIALALPRDAAFEAAADRLDQLLENRAARPGKPLPQIPLRLAEQFRDDLRMFATMGDGPRPAPTSPRAKFTVIRGGNTEGS